MNAFMVHFMLFALLIRCAIRLKTATDDMKSTKL